MTSLRFSRRTGMVALALVLGTSLLTGCEQKTAAPAAPVLKVRVIAAEPSTETVWLESLGETEGLRQVEVRAQVSGILQEIAYQEGSRVKAGQTLFILDEGPYHAALRAATAKSRQAKSAFERAKRDRERYQNLVKYNAVSRKIYEDARSEYDNAHAALEQALAQERESRINLERTRVKAPSDGAVGRSYVNQGALVTATSTLLTTLTQPDRLRVKFQVSERDIAGKTITLENKIRVFDSNRNEVPAKLDFIDPQVDVATATRTIRADIVKTQGVYPGQLLHLQLAIDELQGVYRIPQRAIQQKPDGTYQVFVEQDGKAAVKPVTVGTWKDTDWIVLGGLSTGDRVIVDQLRRMREGSQVKATLVERSSVR